MLSRCKCLYGHSRFARLAHSAAAPIQDARWPGWQVVIGIEVHAQIKSRRKLFSESLAQDHGASANTHVSAYDAAFPGTLPRLNPVCVNLAVRTALALHSDVQPVSAFDRKHYFYSDLPSGYQITQQYSPVAVGGHIALAKHGSRVRVKQLQIEQDTGKSTFDARRRVSSIDLNRAGTGLMEIVSEPDIRSPEAAGDYIRTLQSLLRAVGSSDGNMDQGSLRCDVNVSVNRIGEPFGTRCEIKNINSVKFAMVAITAEVFRHIAVIESGGAVSQETRGFDEAKAATYALRSKEDAPDYRYMPDPNLPPLRIDKAYIDRVRASMPEMPGETRARLASLGLGEQDIEVLMAVDAGREVGFDGQLGHGAVAFFDEVAKSRDPKIVVNWIIHELLGQLAVRDQTFGQSPVSVAQMGELVDMVQNSVITGTAAKTLLRHMLDNSSTHTPSELAKELSLLSVSDGGDVLAQWCTEAINAMPREAEDARNGDTKVLHKFVGRVMKLSRGTANAQSARATLEEMLRR